MYKNTTHICMPNCYWKTSQLILHKLKDTGDKSKYEVSPFIAPPPPPSLIRECSVFESTTMVWIMGLSKGKGLLFIVMCPLLMAFIDASLITSRTTGIHHGMLLQSWLTHQCWPQTCISWVSVKMACAINESGWIEFYSFCSRECYRIGSEIGIYYFISFFCCWIF